MSAPARGTPYGATAWHQTSWDWRAAGNFIGGGAGAGVTPRGLTGLRRLGWPCLPGGWRVVRGPGGAGGWPNP